jgi:hypothetical protein
MANNDPRILFEPFVSTLEEFADEHGMIVRYDSGEHAWADPACQLGFVNSSGQMCFLYLLEGVKDQLLLRLMRYGIDRLITFRDWQLPATASTSMFYTALKEAWECANSPVGE